jgi:hypothetical protein
VINRQCLLLFLGRHYSLSSFVAEARVAGGAVAAGGGRRAAARADGGTAVPGALVGNLRVADCAALEALDPIVQLSTSRAVGRGRQIGNKIFFFSVAIDRSPIHLSEMTFFC